jgi:hypothetical protein
MVFVALILHAEAQQHGLHGSDLLPQSVEPRDDLLVNTNPLLDLPEQRYRLLACGCNSLRGFYPSKLPGVATIEWGVPLPLVAMVLAEGQSWSPLRQSASAGMNLIEN